MQPYSELNLLFEIIYTCYYLIYSFTYVLYTITFWLIIYKQMSVSACFNTHKLISHSNFMLPKQHLRRPIVFLQIIC
jgi:hypothetical protein